MDDVWVSQSAEWHQNLHLMVSDEDEGEGETNEESDGEGDMRVAALLAEEEESNVFMTCTFT